MVDLTRTSPEILSRYMGRERAQGFLAWHQDIAAARGVNCARCFR